MMYHDTVGAFDAMNGAPQRKSVDPKHGSILGRSSEPRLHLALTNPKRFAGLTLYRIVADLLGTARRWLMLSRG